MGYGPPTSVNKAFYWKHAATAHTATRMIHETLPNCNPLGHQAVTARNISQVLPDPHIAIVNEELMALVRNALRDTGAVNGHLQGAGARGARGARELEHDLGPTLMSRRRSV